MHDPTARVLARIDENRPAEVTFLREIVSHRSELFAERSVQLAMRQKLAGMGVEVDTFDADVAEIASVALDVCGVA